MTAGWAGCLASSTIAWSSALVPLAMRQRMVSFQPALVWPARAHQWANIVKAPAVLEPPA